MGIEGIGGCGCGLGEESVVARVGLWLCEVWVRGCR